MKAANVLLGAEIVATQPAFIIAQITHPYRRYWDAVASAGTGTKSTNAHITTGQGLESEVMYLAQKTGWQSPFMSANGAKTVGILKCLTGVRQLDARERASSSE